MGTKITIILYFSLSLQIKDVKARMIDQIIDYNKTFVAQKGYEKYLTIKTYPSSSFSLLTLLRETGMAS